MPYLNPVPITIHIINQAKRKETFEYLNEFIHHSMEIFCYEIQTEKIKIMYSCDESKKLQ